MAEFVSGRYEIYTQKEKSSDSASPFGSGSPSRKQGVASNQRTNFGKLAKLGGAIIGAKQMGTTVLNEMSATTGDERMMKDISNVGGAVAFGLLAVKAPPLAVLYGAQQGLQTVANYRQMQRENADNRMQRNLQGARSSNNRGGIR